MTSAVCPCGDPRAYATCCEPLHDRIREAATAEELMRSRYSAYATGRIDYVFRTWHPRTRPVDLLATGADPATRWLGLVITAREGGGPDDSDGVVVFEARWASRPPARSRGVLRERSRFVRRGPRWVYVAPEP